MSEDANSEDLVLAITSNTSLVVSLSLIGAGWNVDAVPDVDSIPEDERASTVLIDLGNSEAGLHAANDVLTRRPKSHIVVVGDREAEPPAGVRLVLRPFTLDDLAAELRGERRQWLVEEPAEASPPDAPPAPRMRFGRRKSGEPASAPEVELQPEAPEAEPSPEPLPPPPDPEPEVIPEPPAPEPEPPPPAPEPEPPPPPLEEAEPSPPPAPQVSPPTDEEIIARLQAPAPGAEVLPPEPAKRLKFRRRAERTPDAEKALVRRIARTLPAVQEVLYLLEDAPSITDRRAILVALLEEVLDILEPETAAVWTAHGSGFGAAVSHGLTKVEEQMKVPADQPLFHELAGSGGGVLIQPTDMAQAAVAGIGGAHTDAFMGAAVAVAGNCYAIITVGAKEFQTADLDALVRHAADAAPGLAIAGLLADLRETLG